MNVHLMESISDNHKSNSLEFLVINICLDWNCVIALEKGETTAPALRQIQEWYRQGKIKLCLAGFLENAVQLGSDDQYLAVIDAAMWAEKMSRTGLTGVPVQHAVVRHYGGMTFDSHLDLLILQEIHKRLFPTIDFQYRDYCLRMGVAPIAIHGFLNITQAYQAASEEQRNTHKKWNNAKSDALGLATFGTWSEPDDIFVTNDRKLYRAKIEKLKEPLVIERKVWCRPPGTTEDPVELVEHTQTLSLTGVIRGQIMPPQAAEKYLRKRLED